MQESQLALFANSLRCNGTSAAEGRPSVVGTLSSRQHVTPSGNNAIAVSAQRGGLRPSVLRAPSRFAFCQLKFNSADFVGTDVLAAGLTGNVVRPG